MRRLLFLLFLSGVHFIMAQSLQMDYSNPCAPPNNFQDSKINSDYYELISSKPIKELKASNYREAIYSNNLKLFRYLLQNTSFYFDENNLYQDFTFAISNSRLEIVKLFFEHTKVNPNITNSTKFYAIYRSVRCLEILKLLIEKGADPNVVGYKNTRALDHALREGCTEVITYLLQNHFPKDGIIDRADLLQHNKRNKKEVAKLIKQIVKERKK